jgi:hypothetical protein
MDMASRKQYLQMLMERYLKARKRQKDSILDEYCRNTDHNRKYVIRRIGRLASTEPRPPGKRAPHYGQETARTLEKRWKIFDFPYGQRLRPLIQTELERLRWLRELEVSAKRAEKLRTISPATIDRLLRPKKEAWKLRHKSGVDGPGLIAKKISLSPPGFDTSSSSARPAKRSKEEIYRPSDPSRRSLSRTALIKPSESPPSSPLRMMSN